MVVLITGASSGIGRELALAYLERGRRVVAVARRAERLRALRTEAGGRCGVLRTVQADVRDECAMAEVVADAERRLGPIELAIANAGVGHQDRSEAVDAAAMARVFETNVLGVARTLAPAAESMVRRRSGHLAIVSSLAALLPMARMRTYGASKAALQHYAEGLRRALRPHGIGVTTVCPGFVDTEMLHGHQVARRWTMDLDRAVARTLAAIDRRRRVACFPRSLHWATRALSVLPAGVREALCEGVVTRLVAPDHSGEHPPVHRAVEETA